MALPLILALTCSAHGQEVNTNDEYFRFQPIAALFGKAAVKDGDGVLLGAVEVRLGGIGSRRQLKKSEPGGPESSENLRAIVDAHQVSKNDVVACYIDGSSTRGRPVGVCLADAYDGPDGGGLKIKDLGRLQVEMGHARDCPRFSGGMYADAEKQARQNGHDLSAIYPLPEYCQR
ncbi:MAG: hypothetical protein GY947_09685 [Rhodobacteraceae bacterium]|nr:hypothetical protein [Paracoccaceae bacterium]